MSRTIEAITKHAGVSTTTDRSNKKSQTMKAVRIHKYGGPEVLQVRGGATTEATIWRSSHPSSCGRSKSDRLESS